jgi:hypothetical protein
MVVIAVLKVTVTSGCTNNPGTLKLTLDTPDHITSTSEPMRILAILSTEKETVCLPKWTRDTQLRIRVFDSAGARVNGPPWRVKCGNALLPWIPLLVIAYPLAAIGGVLDVADIGGRFDVVQPGKPVVIPISIAHVQFRPNSTCISIVGPKFSTEMCKSESALWIPDEYRIVVTVPNEYESSFPPPLFWQPYSHPLTAEIKVRVSDDGDGPTSAVTGL